MQVNETFLKMLVLFIRNIFNTPEAYEFVSRMNCPQEKSTVNNSMNRVIWPEHRKASGIPIISDPLCLNSNRELIVRHCNITWTPSDPPECSYTQFSYRKIEKCPPPYRTVSDQKTSLCLLITEPRPWEAMCVASGSTKSIIDLDSNEQNLVFSELTKRGVTSAWLPAKRTDSFGPLVWYLPGLKWGHRFDYDDYGIPVFAQNKIFECLLINLYSNYSNMAFGDCLSSRSIVCVLIESDLLQLSCPAGYFSTRYHLHQNRCFGIETYKSPKRPVDFCENRIEIKSANENKIAVKLMDEYYIPENIYCLIGLKRDWKSFEWENSKQTLNFTNWSIFSDFSKGNRVAVTEQGFWIVLPNDEKFSCAICEKEQHFEVVTFSLKFFSNLRTLQLSVYFDDGLWKESNEDPGFNCFTNAAGDLRRKVDLKDTVWKGKWTVDTFNKATGLKTNDTRWNIVKLNLQKTVYNLDLKDFEPGEFWCEGHQMPNFTSVYSETVVAFSEIKGHIFVIVMEIFKMCLPVIRCDPVFAIEYVKRSGKIMEKIMEDSNISNVRAMKILNIDADTGNMKVLYHVTSGKLDSDITQTFEDTKYVAQSLTNRWPAKYSFVSMNSSEWCLPCVTVIGKYKLSWTYTKVDETAIPNEICLSDDGLPITRKCIGNFLFGATWSEVNGTCAGITPSLKTSVLFKLANNYNISTKSATQTLLSSLSADVIKMIPTDIYYLAKIVKGIASVICDVDASDDVTQIAFVIENIMRVNQDTLKLSQTTLNSTNILLDSFNKYLEETSIHIPQYELNSNNGAILFVTPLVIIQISDPAVKNISGLALFKKSENHKNFLDYSVQPLTSTRTLEELIDIEYLEVAAWVPQELINKINLDRSYKNISRALRITTVIFYNDAIFQKNKDFKKVNSRIVSISIPGYGSYLPQPIPILFKSLASTDIEKQCVFWDYTDRFSKKSVLGDWSSEGCYYIGNSTQGENLNICACSHLTNFALLVKDGRNTNNVHKQSEDTDEKALNIITAVGCALSLCGIFGIALTGLVFKAWRRKPSSKILIQFSIALSMQMSLFLISSEYFTTKDQGIRCQLVGVSLHYFLIASFSWMLVIAFLQYLRYVCVFEAMRPPRLILKASFVAWGLPVLPVSSVIYFDFNSYHSETSKYCYPVGLPFYLGVMLPIGLIVSANLVVFILIFHNILRVPNGKLSHSNDNDLIFSHVKLAVLLFFLLGLSWIFGIGVMTSGVILFSYLFCLTATLQGFIMFVFFIICDPGTRMMWGSLFKSFKRFSTSESKSDLETYT